MIPYLPLPYPVVLAASFLVLFGIGGAVANWRRRKLAFRMRQDRIAQYCSVVYANLLTGGVGYHRLRDDARETLTDTSRLVRETGIDPYGQRPFFDQDEFDEALAILLRLRHVEETSTATYRLTQNFYKEVGDSIAGVRPRPATGERG
jgi:hypothetical protein